MLIVVVLFLAPIFVDNCCKCLLLLVQGVSDYWHGCWWSFHIRAYRWGAADDGIAGLDTTIAAGVDFCMVLAGCYCW